MALEHQSGSGVIWNEGQQGAHANTTVMVKPHASGAFWATPGLDPVPESSSLDIALNWGLYIAPACPLVMHWALQLPNVQGSGVDLASWAL